MNPMHNCDMQGCSSGVDLGTALQSSSIGPQLQRLSFAFSVCLLCVEGTSTFELKLAEHISKLYGVARYCGISLQYFYAASQHATQV